MGRARSATIAITRDDRRADRHGGYGRILEVGDDAEKGVPNALIRRHRLVPLQP